MQSTWLNTLANWNPQLLREFRGRLKLRSVLAAIALSLIVQLLMVLGVISAIDSPPTGVSKVLWEKEKWRDLWESMAWMMSYILFAAGAYFLVNDISQEERSGTMNFIRSSPRPPYQILIGKLLGVPILPYLAIAMAFPLHWFAGLHGGVPPLMIGSYDLLLGAGCVLFFSPALLLGLLNNTQRSVAGQSLVSFAYTGLMIFSFIPLYLTWNFQTTWKDFWRLKENTPWSLFDKVQWGFLPLSENIGFAHLFVLANIAIITFFVWRMLLRRFYNHSVSAMSKRLSYALVAYIQILVIGFALQTGQEPKDMLNIFMPILYIVNVLLFVSLIFALCPTRQAVLDWLRYRQPHRARAVSPPASATALWRDLVWADGSPGVVAIALNLLIANALAWPWFVLMGLKQTELTQRMLFLSAAFLLLLIFATLTQQLFIARLRNPAIWAVGIIITWFTVPPILMSLLKLMPDKIPATSVLWTVWGFPGHLLDVNPRPAVITGTMIGIVLQLLLFGLLLWQLQQQLRRLAAPVTLPAQPAHPSEI
jgi:hypothetical protein